MTVKTFRKRPIEIQAIQWTGDNEREIREWCGPSMFGALQPAVHRDPEITAEVLDTLHSTWVGVKTGQWIVRGVKGEYYPIAEDVLAETYEPVAEAGEDDAPTCRDCDTWPCARHATDADRAEYEQATGGDSTAAESGSAR